MSGPQDGQEIVVERDDLHIGRGADADVQLAHDPEIPALGVSVARQTNGLAIGLGEELRVVQPGELFRVGLTWLKVNCNAHDGAISA